MNDDYIVESLPLYFSAADNSGYTQTHSFGDLNAQRVKSRAVGVCTSMRCKPRNSTRFAYSRGKFYKGKNWFLQESRKEECPYCGLALLWLKPYEIITEAEYEEVRRGKTPLADPTKRKKRYDY